MRGAAAGVTAYKANNPSLFLSLAALSQRNGLLVEDSGLRANYIWGESSVGTGPNICVKHSGFLIKFNQRCGIYLLPLLASAISAAPSQRYSGLHHTSSFVDGL